MTMTSIHCYNSQVKPEDVSRRWKADGCSLLLKLSAHVCSQFRPLMTSKQFLILFEKLSEPAAS